MMTRTATLLAAVALTTATVEAAPPACKKLTALAYPQADGRVNEQRAPSFSAAKVADVEFRIIAARGASETEQFELRLFTPARHLYQAITVQVSLPSKHGEKSRSVPGYPFPVPLAERAMAVGEGKGDQMFSARFPLGGSLVSTASLYGRWHAEVWPEGDDRPCAALRFTVTP